MTPLFLAQVLLMLSSASAVPGHFEVEASLEDGREVKGILDSDRFEFNALVTTGETVRIAVVSPPEWSSLRTMLRISRSPKGGRFLIRAFNWTGEAGVIRLVLPLRTTRGALLLQGSELHEARFTWSP